MIVTVFASLLALAMLLVIYFDATRYVIPNWLNLAILAAFPVWWFLSPIPIDWLGGVILFGLLLVIGFGCFALGFMGAGDVKLLAVLGLYLGWQELAIAFIVYMGLIGGILTLLLIIARRLIKHRKTKPRLLTQKEPVPYGLAIAGSFLILLASGRVPGMAALF